jgi:hypothetical protein
VFGARVTIMVGHFGSGKTEIAVNGALEAAREGAPVALVDLDVVKPYFRSRAARALLAEHGVRLVAPEGENIFADLPIIVPQIRSLLKDPASKVLMDAGGDDTGARVLGSLADVIPVAETAHLLVLNFRRPFTDSVESAVTMVREIEAAARLRVTGLVSNTHLMGLTTPEVVLEGYELARATGETLGLPVVAVTVDEETSAQLGSRRFDCPLVVLRRVVRPPFDGRRRERAGRPVIGLC